MPKPTGFLDLPREIRDEIYNYLLVSPTKYVAALYPPTSSSSSKSCNSSSRFLKRPSRSHLHVVSCPPTYQHRQPSLESLEYTLPSLSISRVSRQLYHETQHTFYAQNTYFTSHPFKSTSTYPSLLRFLKALGQSASRKLQNIVIQLPDFHSSYKFFGKILQALSSRARHGDFKKLVIHITDPMLIYLIFARDEYLGGGDSEAARIWEGMLRAMREAGGKNCRFEREIVCTGGRWTSTLDGGKDVARDFNLAFGGRHLWGSKLQWVDGRSIDDIPEMPMVDDD